MKNVLANIIPHHLSYADIRECTRVCHTWFDAFNPHLALVRKWMSEKTPERFMNEALEKDDLRLVEFAINVLKVDTFDDWCIRSRKIYVYISHYMKLFNLISAEIDIKFRDLRIPLVTSVSSTNAISFQIKYGIISHLDEARPDYMIAILYADNVNLLKKVVLSTGFTTYHVQYAAVCGSFKCLDYFLTQSIGRIEYHVPIVNRNFLQENFEGNMEKLVNNQRIVFDWDTVFKMSVLNNSIKWFNEARKHIDTNEIPFSPDAIRLCRNREILMILADDLRNHPSLLEKLRENGDKRVIEKLDSL